MTGFSKGELDRAADVGQPESRPSCRACGEERGPQFVRCTVCKSEFHTPCALIGCAIEECRAWRQGYLLEAVDLHARAGLAPDAKTLSASKSRSVPRRWKQVGAGVLVIALGVCTYRIEYGQASPLEALSLLVVLALAIGIERFVGR